jgi:hypothetical protein
MPLITLPAPPPIAGPTDLGNAITQGVDDYVGRQDAATRRAQALQDVASNRQFEQDEFDRRQKSETAADAQRQQAELKRAVVSALIAEKLLDPADAGDDAKISAAYQQAKQLGLTDRYKDMIQNGDLSIKDIGDPEKVRAAYDKQAQRNKKRMDDAVTQQTNAQARADSLDEEQKKLASQLQELDQQLALPAEKLIKPPSDSAVQNAALQMAREQTGNPNPKPADIQAALGPARQALLGQALQEAQAQKQQNIERQKELQGRLTANSQEIDALGKQGIYATAPDDSGDDPSPVTDIPPAGAAPSNVDPKAQAAALQSLLGGPKPGGAGANPVADVAPAGYSADPIAQRAAKITQSQQLQSQVTDPLAALAQQEQETDQQIAAIHSAPPAAPVTMPGFSPYPGMAPSAAVASPGNQDQLTIQQAAQLKALYAKKAQIQTQRQKLTAMQQQMQGGAAPATGSPAAVPIVSDIDGTTPAAVGPAAGTQWWKDPDGN